jgi:hypothetical protein
VAAAVKGTGIGVGELAVRLFVNAPELVSVPNVTDPEADDSAITVKDTGVVADTNTVCDVGLKVTLPAGVAVGVTITEPLNPDAGVIVTVKDAEEAAGSVDGKLKLNV